MQGLVFIHVVIECIVNFFMLTLNFCFQVGAVMIQSIITQYDTNLEGKYLKTCIL